AYESCADELTTLLSEHGEVTVTTDASGRCVAVTRQDGEGRILSTIWEASEHGGVGEAVADDDEKWGQQFRCGCFLGYPTKRAIPHFCPQHSRGRQGSALPLSSTFTTPPTPSAPVLSHATLLRIA